MAANAYLTLATADADGRPWATPVWFAVGIVVVDSSVEVGAASAVYVEADAEEVGPDDRAAALADFNGRAQEQGIGSWNERDVSGRRSSGSTGRGASRVYVLDEHDGRVEVGGSSPLPLSHG